MREFELLEHIYRRNAGLPGRVTIPPGDDMGAVRIGGVDVLVTVDQVIDSIHFDSRTTSIEKIARKAITRNLSDVAAMAAKPVGAVVAACLPRSMTQAQAQELSDHMQRVANAYDCPLFGGDISISDRPLAITVTVLAEPAGIAPVLRRSAAAGDAVYVTGRLGGSLEIVAGYVHHLDFEPRLTIARRLASVLRTRPSAMIDISDGLGRDLSHIADASGVSAEIDAPLIPVSDGAHQVSKRDGKPAWLHALLDGEDYELCFTISPERAAAMPHEIEGVPITRIGTIVARQASAVRVRREDGSWLDAAGLGWEHVSS